MPKTTEFLSDFKRVTEQLELQRTLMVSCNDKTYRLELLYRYSNEKNPWEVDVYVLRNRTWQQVEIPWIQEREEEAALRMALSFIQDGKAA